MKEVPKLANIKSAEKRIRVIERKTLRNKMVKSQVRTLVKKYEAAIGGNDFESARAMFPNVVKKLDQALAKGVFVKNTISRTKSRLQTKLNQAN